MLPKDDVELQAEAFLGFAARAENRGVPVQRLFNHWARSKDFWPEDRRAIWRVVCDQRCLQEAR